MAIIRRCDACKNPIPQRQFVELGLRILSSSGGETQDPSEQLFGDYCNGCVASGAAIEDLVGSLTKYKGLEPELAAIRAAREPSELKKKASK